MYFLSNEKKISLTSTKMLLLGDRGNVPYRQIKKRLPSRFASSPTRALVARPSSARDCPEVRLPQGEGEGEGMALGRWRWRRWPGFSWRTSRITQCTSTTRRGTRKVGNNTKHVAFQKNISYKCAV